MSFLALLRTLGPEWLVGDEITEANGTKTKTDSRILGPIALLLDAERQSLRDGVRARMPGVAPLDALSYIGGALKILRGPEEGEDAYRARLIRGIDDLRQLGIAWGMLEQIRGYCTPHAVRVRLVNNHGNMYTIDRDGSRSIDRHTAWNWDGDTAAWARFWVLIYMTTGSPQKPWAQVDSWGDVGLTWGTEGKTWGSTATPADVFSIRRIVRDWKPSGSTCVSIIPVFNDTAFDPSDTAPPLPDGTWHTWGRYGVTPGRKTPARSSDAIYWRGTGEAA